MNSNEREAVDALKDAIRWLNSIEKYIGTTRLLNLMPNNCLGPGRQCVRRSSLWRPQVMNYKYDVSTEDPWYVDENDIEAVVAYTVEHCEHSRDCMHGNGFTYDFCPIANGNLRRALIALRKSNIVPDQLREDR